MTVKEAAHVAPKSRGGRTAKAKGSGEMVDPITTSEGPILSISSTKMLAMFGGFLTLLASGFLFLVVHVWDDINKHLEKIDGQLSGLSVTQGKFEQFLTSELPSITQSLQRNTEIMVKLESNVSSLTQSVAQVQHQVSIAAEKIQSLKDQTPLKKSLFVPLEAARPTIFAK